MVKKGGFLYNLNMSNAICRLFLVLMLTLAIPVQGVASSLMLVCEMDHRTDVVVSSHDHLSTATPHAHSDSVELNELTLSTGQNASELIGFNVDHDHLFSSDSHQNDLKHNHCCSSVASSVMTSMTFSSIPSRNNSAEFSYLSSFHLPPYLGGLDRPPRVSLV